MAMILNRLKWPLRPLAGVLVLAFLSGCAYFNTFYHAKQSYGQAEKARAQEHGQISASSTSSTYYKQAIQKCEKVIEKYPGSKWADDAYLLMAQSHYWRGDYLSAEETLTSLLGLKKSSLRDQALYWQGRTYLAQESYTEAQSVWQALLKDYPKFKDRQEVEYYMAQASWLGGSPDAAIGEYQAFLKRYPNGEHSAPARLDLGELLVQQKHYDEAEKVFAYVAQKGKLEDDRIQARISLGDVLEKQARNEEALKLYTDLEVSLDASVRKSRMSWQARQQMELEEQKRRDQAMQDSIRLASVDPQGNNDPNQLDPNGNPLNASGIHMDANGNWVDPSGNPVDPNTVFQMQQQNAGMSSKGTVRKTPVPQRDANDPKQKELAQVLIREGCVLGNLKRPDEAITAFQQVVAEYPSTPFAAEAQYRIGYTYEVHKEEFDRAQLAYDAVSRQGNSSFRDEAVRRSKNLVTLKTLMASASKDSASAATSAAAESRFMRAELYLFQQENVEKAVDEYASIEKEFKGTEHAAKAGLALAWIMEHDQGDSAKAMTKYTEVAQQYPNTEYGRRAHEVVYGPEPEPEPRDFEGPSLAELITPENQQSAYAQAIGDSAASAQNLASTGGLPNAPGGGINPGVAMAGGAMGVGALAHGMAPDETGPPLLTDVPADSALFAGSGPADPNTVLGLSSPVNQNSSNPEPAFIPAPQQAQPGGGPALTSASTSSGAAGAVGTQTTAAGATGAAAAAATGAAGSSLADMVKSTREHSAEPAGALPDSTHAGPHDSTTAHSGPVTNTVVAPVSVNPALPGGLYLDPLAVPVDGPSPVTKPDSTSAGQKAATDKPADPKPNAKPAASSTKDSKSSPSSGKNSSKNTAKPKASEKNAKKGAAPDSTSGKGSP
jgi:TolA-binding protein